MKHIYLNLKRFDIPKSFHGVNQIAPIEEWASHIIKSTQQALKKYKKDQVEFAMYFPEAHLLSAIQAKDVDSNIQIGCQSVYREDTKEGGNFGAFTTNRPASSMKAVGCETALIGHCEERNDKAGILSMVGAENKIPKW